MEAITAASDMYGTYCCGGEFLPRSPIRITCYESRAAGQQPNGLLLSIPATTADCMAELLGMSADAGDGSGSSLGPESFCTNLSLEQYGVLSTVKTLMTPISSNTLENAVLSAMLQRLSTLAAPLTTQQDSLLAAIKSLMLPKAVCSLTAHLAALTIHRPGNAQAPCINATASGNLGTLILCLPQPHSGGRLKLKAGPGVTRALAGREHLFDWAAGSCSGLVQWAAFYPNTQQELLPVTSGHRITLTYKLILTPSSEPGPLLPGLSPSSTPFHAALLSALADPAFLPAGGTLGFGCHHAYPHTQEGLCTTLPSLLRGRDAALFASARALNLNPEVLSAIDVSQLQHLPDWVGIDDDDDGSPPAAERGEPHLRLNTLRPFGTSDFEDDFASMSRRTVLLELLGGSRQGDHVAWCRRPGPWALQLVNPTSTKECAAMVRVWRSAAVILVKVPPSAARRGGGAGGPAPEPSVEPSTSTWKA